MEHPADVPSDFERQTVGELVQAREAVSGGQILQFAAEDGVDVAAFERLTAPSRMALIAD